MLFVLPDDIATISFLDKETVAMVHSGVLTEGQLPGVLNESALESALGRVTSACCYDATADFAKLAAYYWHGLSCNHAFADGNKRTGFTSMVVFLSLNGLEFVAPDSDMGPLIEDLFCEGRFTLEVLDEIVRTNTRPML